MHFFHKISTSPSHLYWSSRFCLNLMARRITLLLQFGKPQVIKIRFWMSKSTHIPLRTCLACREKKQKTELVRFILNEDQVHIDCDFKLPGRGAYTCAIETCFHTVIKRKGFYRAFRQKVQIDIERLTEEFSACLKKKS